jgi:hypothetical protein
MSAPTFEQPIQNPGVFDILGVRKDGGIDAVAVAATPIDGQPQTLAALATKIRNYIRELSSEGFRARYLPPGAGTVRILVNCHGPVDSAALGLIASLRREAAVAAITIEVVDVDV